MCILVHTVVCTAHTKLYSITVGKYNRLNNSASLFLFFLNKTIRCIFFVILLKNDNGLNVDDKVIKIVRPYMTSAFLSTCSHFPSNDFVLLVTRCADGRDVMGVKVRLWVGD